MFKQNILKLRYCAFKISLMSNLNRYIFPWTFKLENVKKCHSYEISFNGFLNVDFILILSFNFLAFSHGETRINSFKWETIDLLKSSLISK